MTEGVEQAGGALHFEDFVPGLVMCSREGLMTADDIVAFAREFDPQPFHTEPGKAATSFFGEHVASGWHTVAFTMRLMVETLPISGGLIGAGVDKISWPRPTRPGDRLHARIEVENARQSRSRPEIGLVAIKVTTMNQADEIVQVMHPRIVVPLRDPG